MLQQDVCMLHNLRISHPSAEARTLSRVSVHHPYQYIYICMHTLTCSPIHACMHVHARTHTLTQFSKELNSQSCIDEEQQHEEQTQIPHLDGHITGTHRYIQCMIHRKKDMYSIDRESRKHANRERP